MIAGNTHLRYGGDCACDFAVPTELHDFVAAFYNFVRQ
jgi:hypothetical protein